MRRRATLAVIGAVVAALAACGEDRPSAAPAAAAAPAAHEMDQSMDHAMRDKDRAAAMLATAGFQDVATAEAAGYTSSLDTLGCFQDPARGGMGVHYINQSLLDANLDITKPEALVYELDAAGHITGLVAHEYIVPVDAWTSKKPPRLFGMDLHRHPTLPLWVLHTWLWKDNPAGVFEDWNAAVRQCPSGVPIFGTDLPRPAA
jgi:predicted small lipoprotein YifL